MWAFLTLEILARYGTLSLSGSIAQLVRAACS